MNIILGILVLNNSVTPIIFYHFNWVVNSLLHMIYQCGRALLMPGRIPVLTPELADYIHARVANIGEEALKISPTSAKEDGSEKKRKRVFSIA